jgi:long-chain acyl-CoA synthetase
MHKTSPSLIGRAKEMIIGSGFNVYPAEVEAVINSHPAVIQSAVVGNGFRQRGSHRVCTAANSETSVDDLVSYINPLLTPYKRPSQIIRLEALPATSTGKILKSKLADSLLDT